MALALVGVICCRTTSGARTKSSAGSSSLTSAGVSSSGIAGVQAAWVELGPTAPSGLALQGAARKKGGSPEPSIASTTTSSQTGLNATSAAATGVLVRVITTAATCPSVNVDGQLLPLQVRSAPSQAYAVTVCEAPLPQTATAAALGNQVLHLPRAMPQRILIVGDTGCRIKLQKNNLQLQDCNNPALWPLAKVAQSIAAAQADLIIHVGDYHYREADCPAGNQECVGSFTGDTWPSWQQDFFSPALPMLEAAPLLLTRGNHEECVRAGNGWFNFLDPRPLPSACTDTTPAYWVTAGDHQIAMIDSANDANMQPSFNSLQPIPGSLVWWVLHRPFLSAGADDETSGTPATLPPAWQNAGALNAVFTGHQHRLAYHQFPSQSWPPELINGNGSTFLDTPTVAGQVLETVNVNNYTGVEWFNFGFATLDRQAGGWAMTAHDQNGNPVINCVLGEAVGTQTSLSCTPLPAASGAMVAPQADDMMGGDSE